MLLAAKHTAFVQKLIGNSGGQSRQLTAAATRTCSCFTRVCITSAHLFAHCKCSTAAFRQSTICAILKTLYKQKTRNFKHAESYHSSSHCVGRAGAMRQAGCTRCHSGSEFVHLVQSTDARASSAGILVASSGHCTQVIAVKGSSIWDSQCGLC